MDSNSFIMCLLWIIWILKIKKEETYACKPIDVKNYIEIETEMESIVRRIFSFILTVISCPPQQQFRCWWGARRQVICRMENKIETGRVNWIFE